MNIEKFLKTSRQYLEKSSQPPNRKSSLDLASLLKLIDELDETLEKSACKMGDKVKKWKSGHIYNRNLNHYYPDNSQAMAR